MTSPMVRNYFNSSANGFGTEIGVTVFAAVAAGIVCTNIQTFDAAAFESLIFTCFALLSYQESRYATGEYLLFSL